MLGLPELDTVFKEGASHKSKIEGQNHLPQPAGHTAFNKAQDGLLFWAESAHFEVMISFFLYNKLSSPTSSFSEIFFNARTGRQITY